MRAEALIVGVLAVWRVTHLLQAEDGPWDVVVRLRRAAGTGTLGRLLDCFYCLSLWVALPATLLVAATPLEGALVWPALSGGAILLERATQRDRPRQRRTRDDEHDEHDEHDDPDDVGAATWQEAAAPDPTTMATEVDDELLRREAERAPDGGGGGGGGRTGGGRRPAGR